MTSCSQIGVPRSVAERPLAIWVSSTGSARIQPTRSPPHSILLAEPMWTTRAWCSPAIAASGGKVWRRSMSSSAVVSSATRSVSTFAAACSRRSRSSVDIERDVGLWKSGMTYAITGVVRAMAACIAGMSQPASVVTGLVMIRAPARLRASYALG